MRFCLACGWKRPFRAPTQGSAIVRVDEEAITEARRAFHLHLELRPKLVAREAEWEAFTGFLASRRVPLTPLASTPSEVIDYLIHKDAAPGARTQTHHRSCPHCGVALAGRQRVLEVCVDPAACPDTVTCPHRLGPRYDPALCPVGQAAGTSDVVISKLRMGYRNRGRLAPWDQHTPDPNPADADIVTAYSRYIHLRMDEALVRPVQAPPMGDDALLHVLGYLDGIATTAPRTGPYPFQRLVARTAALHILTCSLWGDRGQDCTSLHPNAVMYTPDYSGLLLMLYQGKTVSSHTGTLRIIYVPQGPTVHPLLHWGSLAYALEEELRLHGLSFLTQGHIFVDHKASALASPPTARWKPARSNTFITRALGTSALGETCYSLRIRASTRSAIEDTRDLDQVMANHQWASRDMAKRYTRFAAAIRQMMAPSEGPTGPSRLRRATWAAALADWRAHGKEFLFFQPPTPTPSQ